MTIKATIKTIGPVSQGTSVATGNEWLKQNILIAWHESNRLQRHVITLWNGQVELFNGSSPQVGDLIEGDLELRTERRGTGDHATAVNIAQLHDIVVSHEKE